MSSDPFVIRDLDDHGVLLATLNRPEKKNAFHDPQWDALATCLDEARAAPRVAAVVLTGAAGHFSSGVDLGSFQGERPPPRADGKASAFHACADAVLAFDKPLLACVRGVAVGGGCTITLVADVVYVGESLRMRLPFASLGLVPEFASSYTLQANIGRQRANELMFSAEWIDAEKAVDLGLAAQRFPDDDVLAATLARAREIAQWPVSALQAIKQTLMVAHRQGIAAAREAEDAAMRRLAGSPENVEAVTAFLEKRRPDFRRFRKR